MALPPLSIPHASSTREFGSVVMQGRLLPQFRARNQLHQSPLETGPVRESRGTVVAPEPVVAKDAAAGGTDGALEGRCKSHASDWTMHGSGFHWTWKSTRACGGSSKASQAFTSKPRIRP